MAVARGLLEPCKGFFVVVIAVAQIGLLMRREACTKMRLRADLILHAISINLGTVEVFCKPLELQRRHQVVTIQVIALPQMELKRFERALVQVLHDPPVFQEPPHFTLKIHETVDIPIVALKQLDSCKHIIIAFRNGQGGAYKEEQIIHKIEESQDSFAELTRLDAASSRTSLRPTMAKNSSTSSSRTFGIVLIEEGGGYFLFPS